MWLSKSHLYERPYNVKGINKSTGLQRDLKVYAKIILSERDKSRISERLLCQDDIVKENTKVYNLT